MKYNNIQQLLNASANGVAGSAAANFLDESASNRQGNKSNERQIGAMTTSSFHN
jgi:hypothetical protein